MDTTSRELELQKVIQNDYCIGCGACTAIEDSPVKIVQNENGQYEALVQPEYVDDEIRHRLDTVCPFTDVSWNENKISHSLFSELTGYHKKIGYYDRLFAGYVIEGSYRDIGSSGGFGSWICIELLNKGFIDEVIHIKGDDEKKFKYSISASSKEVLAGSKSRYYPVEMSDVLEYVKNENKRFAIVGIPCFITSIRLLTRQDEILNKNIAYTIGLVCGHLKSSFYADMLAWKFGVKPDKSYTINFREKVVGKKANDYGTRVTYHGDGELLDITKMNSDIFGTSWGYGFFKYNACDFCDDVLAETADVTVGDAWLPEYIEDYRGTNIIISRNKIITKLLDEAFCKDRIYLEPLSEDKITGSQAGGFRHRHDGLSYRLYLKDSWEEWRPKKRIDAGKDHLSIFGRFSYRMRMIIRTCSFRFFKKALQRDDLDYFDRRMRVITGFYRFLIKNPIYKLLSAIKSKVYD